MTIIISTNFLIRCFSYLSLCFNIIEFKYWPLHKLTVLYLIILLITKIIYFNDINVKLFLQCLTYTKDLNTHLQLDQTPQMQLPIIASYSSLSTGQTVNCLTDEFPVSTNNLTSK